MIVHGVVAATAVLGALHLAGGGWPARPAALLPYAAAHALAFLGALGIAVPYLALGLESRVSRTRLGWIGTTPWGALAETAGRGRAVTEPPDAPIRIGEPHAAFRLDALVHPMCAGCGPVVSKLVALEKRYAGGLSIGLHLPPRDAASRADHELCAAVSAVGLVAGGAEGAAAFLRAKESAWPMLRAAESGAESLVGQLLPRGVGATPDDLARAREAVAAADRLGQALERGTPTLLINGRFWDGSIGDLEALLARHADLLRSVLGSRA
jgi:hypothetical protein